MSEPFFLIITGLPGTGKSTLSAALAAELKAVHLNTDVIREEMSLQGRYDPRTKARVYQELLRQAELAMDRGRPVIIDGTFYREALRRPFVRLADGRGEKIRWIELRAGEENIRRRVGQGRAHSEADFEVYLKIRAIYEPLDCAHLVLWSDQMPVEEMVRRAKDFLMLPG